MAKLRQTSAFGPGVYRGIPFTSERLKNFIDSSNKALLAGINIPILTHHAPINASDTATAEFANKEGKGWVTNFFQDDSGALGWEADNVPDDFVKQVEAGTVKLTSPEFRDSYKSEKEGVFEGSIIRHMAFTPLPGNPHQSPVEAIALEEVGVFQFSELDKEPIRSQHAEVDPTKPKKKDDEAADEFTADTAETSDPVDVVAPESPAPVDPLADNPDAPPKATDKSKLAAVIAGLAQKNIVLPSDFDFQKDGAIDILVGCINSAISAENKAEAEEKPEEEESPAQEVAMPFSEGGRQTFMNKKEDLDWLKSTHLKGKKHPAFKSFVLHGNEDSPSKVELHEHKMPHYQAKPVHTEHFDSQHSEQFSEAELAALPPKARAIVEQAEKNRVAAEAKAVQYAEQAAIARADQARSEVFQFIESKKLPPVLANQLKEAATTIQFSEGGKEPLVYTVKQVAEMMDKALPPDMRFHEGEVTEASLPKGVDTNQFFEDGAVPSGHVSDERARKLVDENPLFKNMPIANGHKSINQLVAEENHRVPNNVMRS